MGCLCSAGWAETCMRGVATASLKVCSAPDQMVPRAGAARRAAVGGAALGGAAGAGAAGVAGVLSRGPAEGRAGRCLEVPAGCAGVVMAIGRHRAVFGKAAYDEKMNLRCKKNTRTI